MAMLITHLAAATCSFTWMLIEWLHTRTPTIIGAVSGAITGLVIITPAAGYVDHTGAFVMGLVGAPLCYGGIMFKNWIGLHSVGGIVGAILTVRHIFLLYLEMQDCF
jgi:ammonium transporter, Amt family